MVGRNDDGMVTLVMTVPVATYDRYTELVTEGVPAHRLLERLMDRDPHDHEHACPTCVRLARRPRHDGGQSVLFAV